VLCGEEMHKGWWHFVGVIKTRSGAMVEPYRQPIIRKCKYTNLPHFISNLLLVVMWICVQKQLATKCYLVSFWAEDFEHGLQLANRIFHMWLN
jgi:Ni,Fe-hydrogenase I cytochrome b subunit